MKKTAILLLALMIFLTACGGEEPTPTTSPHPESTAPSSEASVPTEPTPTTEPTSATDPSGPVEPAVKTIFIRTASTSASGSAVARTEYLFDDRDRVIEVVVYTNGVETKRHQVESDSHGNYTRWVSNGSVIEYRYDELGNPLGHASYMGDVLISETIYTWDGNRRTGVTTRMPAQGLEHRSEFSYTESGLLKRQNNYVGNTLSNYSIYTQGEDEKIKEMTTYQVDGSLQQTISYTYEDGITTGAVTAPDGTVIQYTEQIYDEHGNLLSVTVYDAQGNMLTQETHSWKAIEVPADSLRTAL